ncbi:MAG: SAM-dependent chlorinase/fluorinase [Actinomycetota bacterium]
MPGRYDTITFLSDYGLVDELVGVVRSVVHELAPHVTMIDLGHGVPPHDVRAGSLTLARAVQYVAPGVIIAAVDPGVGSERRAVAVEVLDGRAVFVGPDNGLLAPAVAVAGGATRAVQLTNPEYLLPAPGATFSGREVFAPAAAHLCNGVELTELGPAIDPVTLLPATIPIARVEGERLVAEVLWVDRFGNCQLNVGPDDVEAWGAAMMVQWRDEARVATRADSYAELGEGRLGLVVDSYGVLALAIDRRSAADELGIGAGDEIILEEAT